MLSKISKIQIKVCNSLIPFIWGYRIGSRILNKIGVSPRVGGKRPVIPARGKQGGGLQVGGLLGLQRGQGQPGHIGSSRHRRRKWKECFWWGKSWVKCLFTEDWADERGRGGLRTFWNDISLLHFDKHLIYYTGHFLSLVENIWGEPGRCLPHNPEDLSSSPRAYIRSKSVIPASLRWGWKQRSSQVVWDML